MQDALGTLEAHAIHEGSCYAVHVRLAEHNGRMYLDLGSDRFDVVEIDPDGWRVLNNQNIVKFRRPSGISSLPYPKAGGSINALKQYINLANPEDWPLIVGFIIGCFHPSGPYPILAVTGEQGSAKSTLLNVIKALTDPSTAPLRSTPKSLRDLAISSNNSWSLAFDNLSDISGWLSDALCRLATGGGFATRTLYSDDEETIFNVKRPVMLNGIDNVIRKHDLADRGIILNLAVIQDERRIDEKEFWGNFEDDSPEILGAILDAVSCALRSIDTVHLASHPRMADFAKWVTAAASALGWEEETFLKAYRKNIREITSLTLDADLVGTAVRIFMEGQTQWEGTATELLNALEYAADERTKKAKGWPGAAHVLSGKLKRSATALRTQGIEVVFPSRSTNKKSIRLEQRGEKSVTSVIERGNVVHHDEMNSKSPMTLSKDRSVAGASYGNEERHTERIYDASIDGNDDCLFGASSINKAKQLIYRLVTKRSEANDGDDASIPTSFQRRSSRGINMRPRLLSDLESIGYEIFVEGSNIRYRYQRQGNPPDIAQHLIEELRSCKAEALTILKMRSAIPPTETPQPQLNVNAEWPPEIQSLIVWFMKLEPPAESFYLEPHLRVIDPEKFFATLRREIETGPSGPRARMGALQSDLRALQAKFHREEH